MSYQQFQPHPVLRSYIDAYWVSKSNQATASGQRIYPDGCIDIILNAGGDFLTDNGNFRMTHEGAYLVGTMTRYKDIAVCQDTYLLGIRFKPLGFSVFFDFSSLHEITNKTIAFDRTLLPQVDLYKQDTINILDTYFCNRLPGGYHSLAGALEIIKSRNGIVAIEEVAKQQYISERQLERKFKRYLGISPKEYADFVRYQHAMQLIQTKPARESLLGVAIATGYYDHAHLTNEIKKYAGLVPSQLQNVGFLQTSSNVSD